MGREFTRRMQTKTFFRRILLFSAIIFLIAIFSAVFLYFFARSIIKSESALFVENIITASEEEQKNSILPLRIEIPEIDVDASIKHMGLTSQGAMDAPESPDDTAWFNLGPVPGNIGSAVISGHYGWKNNIPAAFDDLYKLQAGDKVYIEDERGVTTVFTVRELRTYDHDGDASDVFSSSDGKAHLNLVTCKGVWDKLQKRYSQRLVVFTDKE